MLRRSPRFLRTRMNESSKEYNNGSAHYGRISYLWSMEDEFEMTDGLNNKIQKVMLSSPKAFHIEKLEKLLSDEFDTKVNLITGNIRPDSFTLSFIGKKVFLSIVVNF